VTCIHTDNIEILLQRKRYFKEGQTKNLTCVGVGYPPPHLVKWRKLDGSLSDISNSIVSNSTNKWNVTRVIFDLAFTKISREDTGLYECLTSGPLKNITRNLSLIVRCTYVHYAYTHVHL